MRQPRPPRERLLDAAYAIVADADWDSLRLAQVARAAGVSRQTAYSEFGSKVGLGRALVEREVDVLVETLMRLTISHVVAPLHEPAEVARDLGALTRLLVMPGDARTG
ncbi:TetR/AcrR family transcriptional regulator [Actinomadura sp. BRA 177]|uniref:TetR/AcrR family transcriptional regulator n=1 Tax=Actinomadura sp. BRA 177 TaxID=2745202 RepID=UPI001595CD9D|nr:TetR/AcrR family transcriptional regulator [Actinomadura sp. BRA 177]NVI91367.1 TetR family transcriptional regulator [Actinomadura sp. BRA 177]